MSPVLCTYVYFLIHSHLLRKLLYFSYQAFYKLILFPCSSIHFWIGQIRTEFFCFFLFKRIYRLIGFPLSWSLSFLLINFLPSGYGASIVLEVVSNFQNRLTFSTPLSCPCTAPLWQLCDLLTTPSPRQPSQTFLL